MIKGLMIIHDDGTPVYSYLKDSLADDTQALLSSLFAALQMFAKGMLKGAEGGGEIKSITLADTMYTFRRLELQTPTRKDNHFYFVLLTEETKKMSDLEEILEYVIMSFLSYNNGEFSYKLRIHATIYGEFHEFNEFMSEMIEMKIGDIKKRKINPLPISFIQGMLNEVRDYLPVNKIITLHPKLISIGPSFVWVSDDLSSEEEHQITEMIKQNLSRVFGPGLYDSLVDRVNSQLTRGEFSN